METRTLSDRYDLLTRAGTGAMGIVYRARDRTTGSTVALKVLSAQTSEGPQRFGREARLLAEIRHPAIVSYVDHGVDAAGGEPYIAMEWLEGETLADRLIRGPLRIGESVRLAQRVAGALGAVHARGIVHRDLTPSNLFLVDGEADQLKLLDFGIAHLGDITLAMTRTGTVIGTPEYMAPEQARGDRTVDARADVFSLGCILYECLTGTSPFRGDHVVAVLAKILFAEAAPPGELNRSVPAALSALCARMLAKDAAARPSDGSALLSELDALRLELPESIAPLPTSTRPPMLGSAEQRVVCVVLSGPPPTQQTQPDGLLDQGSPLARLEQATAPLGARFERLAGGSIAATLGSAGAATDLAVAAARCALSMKAELRDTALALATGRGVLGGRTPVGEVIDRAAALLKGAGGDRCGIAIDEPTASLLDARFTIEAPAGLSHLVLQKEVPPSDTTRRFLGRETAMVGRARELRQLAAIFAQCAAEPMARAAVITGIAGIGKSRLRYELLRRIQAIEPSASFLIGWGDAMKPGSAYGVLAHAVRRTVGLKDGEAPELSRAKLRARAGRSLPGEERDRIAAFLGEMIGLPFPEEVSPLLRAARRDALLMGDHVRRAWEAWLDAECREQPVVLVLEDLHWGDAPTVALVDAALGSLAPRPLFVLALGRPELGTTFPDLWAGRPIDRIQLRELPPRASAELVREALGADVPQEILARIVERAGGNAFFLEELIRAVKDGHAEELPLSVAATVQVRLDAMPADLRRALRAAAVFGEVFWRGGVRALLGEPDDAALDGWLAALAEAELVTPQPDPKFPGERGYVFRHALVRETAYQALTDEDRTLGHRLAADWLLAQGESDPLVLAEHFDRSDLPDESVAHYRSAAEHALSANDFAAALSRAERGLARRAPPDVVGALKLVEAEACAWRGEPERAAACALEAVELLPTGGTAWFRAVEHAVGSIGRTGEYDVVEELALRANDAASSAESAGAQVTCISVALRHLLHAGRSATADRLAERMERLIREHASLLDPSARAEVYRMRAARARQRGDVQEDVLGYAAALDAYEEAGDVRQACNARASLGFACAEIGDLERAESVLRRALGDSEQMGLASIATRARHNLGMVLAERGALEEADAMETRAAGEARAQGNARLEAGSRVYLSAIALRRGDAARAEEEARAAVHLFSGTPPARAGALAALARALAARGGGAEAIAAAREAMATLAAHGSVEEYESLIWLALAEALLAAGDPLGARDVLARAKARLLQRAATIRGAEDRRRFLENDSENARILQRAAEAGAT